MAYIKVIKPGMYSTIQDKGRFGFRKYGVPTSGVMDDLAYETANKLLENDLADAVIEMTLSGGSFEFEADTYIAITGADMSPTLNGYPKPLMWRTLKIKKGDVIAFQSVASGCRTYLAVKGGVQLPLEMESRSTYIRANLGKGLLKCGDTLKILSNQTCGSMQLVCEKDRPRYENRTLVKVILGPHEDAFTPHGIQTFLNKTYFVSSTSDRMGYRLQGPSIEHKTDADIRSDGIVRGAIQVPGRGEPIVLLSDCQTSGGYTKIAHVITSDLWKMGQLKPGDGIRFEAIDIYSAQKMKAPMIKRTLIESEWSFKIKIHSKQYDVHVDLIKEGGACGEKN